MLGMMFISNYGNIEIISPFLLFEYNPYFMGDASEDSILVGMCSGGYNRSANNYQNSLCVSPEYFKIVSLKGEQQEQLLKIY